MRAFSAHHRPLRLQGSGDIVMQLRQARHVYHRRQGYNRGSRRQHENKAAVPLVQHRGGAITVCTETAQCDAARVAPAYPSDSSEPPIYITIITASASATSANSMGTSLQIARKCSLTTRAAGMPTVMTTTDTALGMAIIGTSKGTTRATTTRRTTPTEATTRTATSLHPPHTRSRGTGPFTYTYSCTHPSGAQRCGTVQHAAAAAQHAHGYFAQGEHRTDTYSASYNSFDQALPAGTATSAPITLPARLGDSLPDIASVSSTDLFVALVKCYGQHRRSHVYPTGLQQLQGHARLGKQQPGIQDYIILRLQQHGARLGRRPSLQRRTRPTPSVLRGSTCLRRRQGQGYCHSFGIQYCARPQHIR